MIFLLLLIVIGLYCYFKLSLHKQRLMKYVGHLPSPKEYPIVGCGINFMGKNTEQIMTETLKICDVIPRPIRIWFGPTLVLLVEKAEDIQTILNAESCLKKSMVYRFLHKDVALFTAEPHIWRPQRKMLHSTFNTKILNSFIPIFNDKTDIMIKNLESMVGKEPFDVSKFLFACTLDMVCATTLGYDVGVQEGQNQDYLESMDRSLELIARRMFNVFLHPNFIYKLTKTYRIERRFIDIAESLSDKIIATKKIEFLKASQSKPTEDEESEAINCPQIFIQQLFKLQKQGLIDDTAIKDQVNLLIFGGNDTSAIATSHAVLLLAMHPDIQDRAIAEIEEVYGSESGPYTDVEHISKLQYLEMIIKEAMRLFPVAPFLSRECTADTVISDCTIPKSTVLVLSVYHLHRNPIIWGPKANTFYPDHFRPESMAARHSYCYLPFSAGPRNCLGYRYALNSMKVMLAALLRNYKFSTNLKLEELIPKFEVTMKLVNRHMVHIEKRN